MAASIKVDHVDNYKVKDEEAEVPEAAGGAAQVG